MRLAQSRLARRTRTAGEGRGKGNHLLSITAVHNGVLILNHFELLGDTPFFRPPAYQAHDAKGPISIQDHGNPVRFRNIWVREFKPVQGKQVRKPFLRRGDKEIPIEE